MPVRLFMVFPASKRMKSARLCPSAVLPLRSLDIDWMSSGQCLRVLIGPTKWAGRAVKSEASYIGASTRAQFAIRSE